MVKCKKCDKTVYQSESVIYRSDSYHASCLKCGKCKKSLKSYEIEGEIGSEVYCKTHYISQNHMGSTNTKKLDQKVDQKVEIKEIKKVEPKIDPKEKKKTEPKIDSKKKFISLEYGTSKDPIFKVLSKSSESKTYPAKPLEGCRTFLTSLIGLSK